MATLRVEVPRIMDEEEYLIASVPAEKKAIEKESFCPTNEIMAKYGIVISEYLLSLQHKKTIQLVWAYYTNTRIEFILYIPPGVNKIFFSSDYKKNIPFLIPFPHRYIKLYLNATYSQRAPHFYLDQVLYTADKLTSESDIRKETLGSFLPNSHQNSPYFCLNFYTNITGPSSDNIISALNDILFAYANRGYNQDYLENALFSRAFDLIDKKLPFVKSRFSSKYLQKHDPEFFATLCELYEYDYNSGYADFDIIKEFDKWIKNDFTFIDDKDYNISITRYLIVLKSLEYHPNFWKNVDYASSPAMSQHDYSVSAFSMYKDFCYNRADMKRQVKDLFPYSLPRKASNEH